MWSGGSAFTQGETWYNGPRHTQRMSSKSSGSPERRYGMSLPSHSTDTLLEEAARLVQQQEPAQICQYIATTAEEHLEWHERGLSLVAARNFLRPKARALMASGLMEKVTGGGWIGLRGHSGNSWLDRMEAVLVELAKRLFNVEFVEYRVPTGSLANGLLLLSVMEPGDPVMALSPKDGGHGSYGRNGYSGARTLSITDIPCFGDDYPIIDLERLAEEAESIRPKWFIIGSDSPLFPYPLREMVEIARGVGARIHYDGAHILGLATGGQFQDPLAEGATVLTASTHKTFPGPVGGIILTNDPDVWDRLFRFMNTSIGNYYNTRAAALAVTLAEMLAFGKDYAEAVVQNAQALAGALDAEGFTVVAKERGFTQSHIVLLDVGNQHKWDRLGPEKIIIMKSCVGAP